MGEHDLPGQEPVDLPERELTVPATPQPLAWLTPARRRVIYGVLAALAPLAVIYGFATQQQADLWLIVAQAALLGGGGVLALTHTPRGKS